jgi:hypothetical protein
MLKHNSFLLVIITLLFFRDIIVHSQEPDYSRTNAYVKILEEHASKKGRERILEYLNDLNASPELKEFIYAFACGDFATADYLKEKIDIHATDPEGRNFLLFHATTPETNDYLSQISWLLNNGLDADFKVYVCDITEEQPDGTYKKETVFDTYIEITTNNSRILDNVLSVYPHLLNKRNPQTGQIPLFRAASTSARFSSLDLLLTLGADIEISDKNGYTPLIYSIIYDSYQNAIQLLVHGADAQRSFIFHNQEYKNVLDFLLNSPLSQTKDAEYEKMIQEKKYLMTSLQVEMNAKNTLINYLQQIKKDEERNISKGKAHALIRFLKGRFGSIDKTFTEKILEIEKSNILDALIDHAAECNSLNEFKSYFTLMVTK